MSASHLYLGQSDFWQGEGKLFLARIAIDSGPLSVSARGVASGYAKDSYSIHEISPGGPVALVTSTSSWPDPSANRLWVLEKEGDALVVSGSTEPFAKEEDVRAVRFIGDRAYVVTFKKTDPLFEFSLADPKRPKLMAELKVPGFSTYLHPASTDRLIGVGFDALDMGDFALFQGLQLSLFQTGDRGLERLANVLIGGRGSFSAATADPHAFYFDPRSRTIGLPAVEVEEVPPGSWDWSSRLRFSGAIFYSIMKDDLHEIARATHGELIPDRCRQMDPGAGRWWQEQATWYDIERIYRIDDRIVTLSRFGLKQWAVDRWDEPLKTVPLASPCFQTSPAVVVW